MSGRQYLAPFTYGAMAWLLERAGLYRPKERRLLEHTILPRYRGDPAFNRVLFVGVAGYVRRYYPILSAELLVTMDCSPRAARHGAAHHIVDRVENLGVYFAPGSFDLIVMHGVIGYGLNDLPSLELAISACHRHLRPEGALILSTDATRPCHGRLGEVEALRRGFTPLVLAPFGASQVVTRLPWRITPEHVMFFLQRRPDAAPAAAPAQGAPAAPPGCS